jgi:phospholipid N-methyltransferase
LTRQSQPLDGRGGTHLSFKPETPFDNIESAQQFVELLIEAIEESRADVNADITQVESTLSERQKEALHLVSSTLTRLSDHMTASRRILNDLRTLRRMLLEERQPAKHIPGDKR